MKNRKFRPDRDSMESTKATGKATTSDSPTTMEENYFAIYTPLVDSGTERLTDLPWTQAPLDVKLTNSIVSLPSRLGDINNDLLDDRCELVERMAQKFADLIIRLKISVFDRGGETFGIVLKRIQEAGIYETAYF